MCICTYFCKLKMLLIKIFLIFMSLVVCLFVCIVEGMKKLTTFPRVCKWCFYRSTIEKPVTITRNSIWAYHFERPNFLWHERVKHLSQIVANEKKNISGLNGRVFFISFQHQLLLLCVCKTVLNKKLDSFFLYRLTWVQWTSFKFYKLLCAKW